MDITASVLTLSGSQFPDPPRCSAMERAMAAHAVGIPSIGVFWDEIPYLVPKILRYAAIDVVEFTDLGEVTPPVHRVIKAEDYGIARIKAGSCLHSSFAIMARRLKTLLARTPLGMTISVEPVAWGSLPTLEDVENLIRAAGSPQDVGIQLDLWQAARQGGIPATPLDFPVAEIELCGRGSAGARYDSLKDEAMDRLLLHEDEELDVRAILGRSDCSGAAVSYEMPRQQWRQELSCLQMAEAMVADLGGML